jgi:hypothetical protein
MNFDSDWLVAKGLPEKIMLLSLQGLANRAAPQIYVVHPKEFQWEITGPLFEFYQRKHGVAFTEVKTAEAALALFSRHAKGYVIWEPAGPATMNVAFTIAGLEDALVVTAEQVTQVEKFGLKRIDDLRGRYTGQTDAQIYRDAYARYWARCTHDSIMLMGGHVGAVRMPAMADWGVRQKMFFHDLSANPIHPEEVALGKKLFSEMTPLGTVFGWHSYGKDTE